MKKLLFLFVFLFITSFIHAQTYVKDEAVMILWPQDGQYYPGKVLSVTGDKYLVTYDGYGSEWNETVGKDRLKKISGETTSNNQQQASTTSTTTTSTSTDAANVSYTSVETIWDMQMDKAGKYIACASAYGNIKVLNAADLTLVKQLEPGKDPLMCVSISDDGTYIAAGGKTVTVYKANTSGGFDSYTTFDTYDGVSKMKFIPGTHNLVIGGAPKADYRQTQVDIWSVDDKKITANLLPATLANYMSAIAVSADGKKIALAFSNAKHGIDIYDATTNKLSFHLVSKMDIVSCAFSPDGNSIVGGGTERKVIMWSISTQKQLWTADWKTGTEDYIYGVAFSPDGKTVAACGAGTGCPGKLYDAVAGTMKKEIGTSNPNGNAIFYSLDNNSVYMAFTTYGDIAKVAVVRKFPLQ